MTGVQTCALPIYVFCSDPTDSNHLRVTRYTINSSGVANYVKNAWVPRKAPFKSSHSTAPMGIMVRRSAFHSTMSPENDNYLYLIWNGLDDLKYVSVLQDYGPNLNEEWFTVAADRLLGDDQEAPTSFVRGIPRSGAPGYILEMVTVDSAGDVYIEPNRHLY